MIHHTLDPAKRPTGTDAIMQNGAEIKDGIKRLLVDNLMLQLTVEQIRDDQSLFGPEGLGLDSVDALQLVVALDKHYGLKIPDPAAAQVILQSVNTITEAVRKLPQDRQVLASANTPGVSNPAR
jgi:acyl carrier protein